MKKDLMKENVGLTYIGTRYKEELQRTIHDMQTMTDQIDGSHKVVQERIRQIVRADNKPRATLIAPLSNVEDYLREKKAKAFLGKGKKYIMFASQGKLYGAPKAGLLTVSRQGTLQSIINDFHDINGLLSSILQGYIELTEAYEYLLEKEHTQQMVFHMRTTLERQTVRLNVLFGEINSYAFLLYDIIGEEGRAALAVQETGTDDIPLQELIITYYKALMEKRSIINKLIEERNLAMMGILRGMRKDMAKLKIAETEMDVVERNKRLRQYKEEVVIQDVKDYQDLDGEYRHKYDEEGNLIETEEYEDKGKNNGLIAILGITFIVVVIAYFLIRYTH